MPEICRFLGIVIAMYHREHNPPHFHAYYGREHGVFSIRGPALTEGNLPRRVVSFVLEWALLHSEELLQDWRLVRELRPPRKIAPLV